MTNEHKLTGLQTAATRAVTRRHFFQECGVGLGAVGLASLLSDGQLFAESAGNASDNPSAMASRPTHFPAKANSGFFLFMAGGPSQLELFDYKPKLQELDGQVVPPSVVANKRFTFLKPDAKLLATRRKFTRYGRQ